VVLRVERACYVCLMGRAGRLLRLVSGRNGRPALEGGFLKICVVFYGRCERGCAMVIRDVIEWTDEIKPNAFNDRVKVEWLSALDGRIAADVLLLAPAEVAALPYLYPRDMDTVMLVSPPHDDIYSLWLAAKVDEANGEYNKFANSAAIFNAHYSSFVRWFADTYAPAQGYNTGLARPLPRGLAAQLRAGV